jgi:L,D-transpeptidase ErfK/SrfK
MQVSHGCIHLYPENAAALFPDVPVGTPVRFINQPVLVGERGALLYLSVSSPIVEYPSPEGGLFMLAMEALTRYKINWDRVQQVVEAKQVIPVPVNANAPSLAHIIAAIKPEKYDFEPYGIEANDAAPPSAPR